MIIIINDNDSKTNTVYYYEYDSFDKSNCKKIGIIQKIKLNVIIPVINYNNSSMITNKLNI